MKTDARTLKRQESIIRSMLQTAVIKQDSDGVSRLTKALAIVHNEADLQQAKEAAQLRLKERYSK